MSDTATGVVVIVVLCACAAAEVAALWYVRRYVARTEHSDQDISEKVHRLRRLVLSVVGGSVAAFVVLSGALSAVTNQRAHSGHAHHDSLGAVLAGIAVPVILLIPVVLMARTVRKALRRIRGTSTAMPNRGRRRLAGVAIGLAYGAILFVGMLLVPRHGGGHAVGVIVVYAVAIFVLASVLAPLLLVRLATTAMPESTAKGLRELADRIGVHVHGYRLMQTRSQKTANAMQVGTLPGLRYVIVTDYLADHLEPAQLAAVVAHELGHARRHHVLRKLALTLGAWAVAEGVLIGIGGAVDASGVVRALAGPLTLLVPVSIVLVQGFFGVRFEKDADDIAAGYVGRAELAAALRCLGELNHTKRDTGRAWSILTQHPGLQERIERLGVADERTNELQPT